MSIAFSISNVIGFDASGAPTNNSYLSILNENLTPKPRPDGDGDDVAIGWLIRPVANSVDLNPEAIGALPISGIQIKQVIMTSELVGREGKFLGIREESLDFRVGDSAGSSPTQHPFNLNFFSVASEGDVTKPYSNTVLEITDSVVINDLTFSRLDGFIGDTKVYFFSATHLRILFQHMVTAKAALNSLESIILFSGSRTKIGRATSKVNMSELNAIAKSHIDAIKEVVETAKNVYNTSKRPEEPPAEYQKVDDIPQDIRDSPEVSEKFNATNYSMNGDLSEWFTLKAEIRSTDINGIVVDSVDPIQDSIAEIADVLPLGGKMPTLITASPCPPGYEAIGVIHSTLQEYAVFKTMLNENEELRNQLSGEETGLSLLELIKRLIALLRRTLDLGQVSVGEDVENRMIELGKLLLKTARKSKRSTSWWRKLFGGGK